MQDKPVSPRQLCGARTRAKGDFRYRTAESIKQRYRRSLAARPCRQIMRQLLDRIAEALIARNIEQIVAPPDDVLYLPPLRGLCRRARWYATNLKSSLQLLNQDQSPA